MIEDVKMSRCEDEKMFRRCEDEQMFYRPPLLEEPCAQTLSGKNLCSIPLTVSAPGHSFDNAISRKIAFVAPGDPKDNFNHTAFCGLRKGGVQVKQIS